MVLADAELDTSIDLVYALVSSNVMPLQRMVDSAILDKGDAALLAKQA